MLWKGVLERVFDDFLRFVFPQVDEVLDLERGFQFLDKELIEIYPEAEKASSTRHVDKLVRVYEKNGAEKYVLVHVEVQGYPDKEFALRMFEYSYRVLDRYKKRMTAIAIFTGADGAGMPDRYEDEFLGTSHVYRYNTLRITDYPDQVLKDSDNPFAVVLLAAKKALLEGKIPEMELKDQKLLVAKLLYGKGFFGKEKINGILIFLNNYVRLKGKEINRIFNSELDQYTGKLHTMDILEQVKELKIEEAREEGRTEEKVNTVRILLKSTDFPVAKIADLVGMPVPFVEEVKADKKA